MLISWFQHACCQLSGLDYALIFDADAAVIAEFKRPSSDLIASAAASAALARRQSAVLTAVSTDVSNKGRQAFTISLPLATPFDDMAAVFCFSGGLQHQSLALENVKSSVSWLQWRASVIDCEQIGGGLLGKLSPLFDSEQKTTAAELCRQLAETMGLSSVFLFEQSATGPSHVLLCESSDSRNLDKSLPLAQSIDRYLARQITEQESSDFAIELVGNSSEYRFFSDGSHANALLVVVALPESSSRPARWLVTAAATEEESLRVRRQLVPEKSGLALLFDYCLASRLPSQESSWLSRGSDFLLTGEKRFKYAAALSLLLLLFIPVDHRVKAKAIVQAQTQRVVIAPFDGFIEKSSIRAGDDVKEGQLLAQLETRDLQLQAQQHHTRIQELDRLYRQALSELNRVQSKIIQAQMAQVQADLELVSEAMTRAAVTAPLAGVVIKGDLSRSLGAAVTKGEILFEVAPLNGYRATLRIAQKDIHYLREAKRAQLVLTPLPDLNIDLTLKNIVPNFKAESVGEAFLASAELNNHYQQLRPGMQGVAKVVVGRRALGWVLFHEVFNWWRIKIWSWWP